MRLTSNRTHIHFPAQHSCHLSSSPQLPWLTNKDVMSLPVLRDITNQNGESNADAWKAETALSRRQCRNKSDPKKKPCDLAYKQTNQMKNTLI